jgi:hypothetical protein
MKLITVACIFLTSFCAPPVADQEPISVSMVQLIANAQKYDGKLIRVIGFLRLEFEGNELYLHREDFEKDISKNGIWVDVYSETMKRSKNLDMHYVLLEGIFSSNDLGEFSGSINKISRAEIWQPTVVALSQLGLARAHVAQGD